jgi:hypothetical protein
MHPAHRDDEAHSLRQAAGDLGGEIVKTLAGVHIAALCVIEAHPPQTHLDLRLVRGGSGIDEPASGRIQGVGRTARVDAEPDVCVGGS